MRWCTTTWRVRNGRDGRGTTSPLSTLTKFVLAFERSFRDDACAHHERCRRVSKSTIVCLRQPRRSMITYSTPANSSRFHLLLCNPLCHCTHVHLRCCGRRHPIKAKARAARRSSHTSSRTSSISSPRPTSTLLLSSGAARGLTQTQATGVATSGATGVAPKRYLLIHLPLTYGTVHFLTSQARTQ